MRTLETGQKIVPFITVRRKHGSLSPRMPSKVTLHVFLAFDLASSYLQVLMSAQSSRCFLNFSSIRALFIPIISLV